MREMIAFAGRGSPVEPVLNIRLAPSSHSAKSRVNSRHQHSTLIAGGNMRVVRSTLFGLLVLGASAGVARAQATQQVPQAHRRQAGMNAGHPGRGSRGLFRGIQLTDAEKASLKTVREKYKGQFKSLQDSFK